MDLTRRGRVLAVAELLDCPQPLLTVTDRLDRRVALSSKFLQAKQ
jgi:hypothetical protein